MRDWLIHLFGGLTEEDVSMAVNAESDWYEQRIDELEETIEQLQALIPKPKGRPRKADITPVKVV